MRVVSLVPSWTETLLEAGVEVVGRTRYCIHGPNVHSIPAVGGTKDWDLLKINALKPDLLILDQEENPRFMAEQPHLKPLCTHVTGLREVSSALRLLHLSLQAPALLKLAERWDKVVLRPSSDWALGAPLPGLLEWGVPPAEATDQIVYMIWRKPWMAVSRDTFIGSMLAHVGFSAQIATYDKKYPEIDLGAFNPRKTLILFSSEPYPFLKKKSELVTLGFPHAFVDGERYSWFGVRALRFLESQSLLV